jgi:hypothetical protein
LTHPETRGVGESDIAAYCHMKMRGFSSHTALGAMLATHPAKRKSRFAWSSIMRALVFLFVVASPVFIGMAISGDGINLRDIRQQFTSSDFGHDAMLQARDYALTHPGLVEAVKAHRSELQELRSRLCSAFQC